MAHALDDPDGDIWEFEEDGFQDDLFFEEASGDPNEEMRLVGGAAESEVVF